MILDTSDKTASLTLTYCAAWSLGQCPVDMGKNRKLRMEHIDIRKDQIKWKTDYLGKCSSMTREKTIPKEPDMFKESREGLSNTLAVRA